MSFLIVIKLSHQPVADCVATLLLNLALVIVNQTIGGNYGMLKHTPFIMGTPLFVKYLAVSGALIILMIIMKKRSGAF